jgi:hypothetical protein
MRSTSRLTKILPCNHARALAESFLGRWPRPRIDFIRLKANSICHRSRYNSSTAAAEKVSGSVVQRAKYWAAVQEAGLTFFCALLALRFNRCRALRVAASLRLMAMSRPWIHSPPGCLIRVLHDCAFSLQVAGQRVGPDAEAARRVHLQLTKQPQHVQWLGLCEVEQW